MTYQNVISGVHAAIARYGSKKLGVIIAAFVILIKFQVAALEAVTGDAVAVKEVCIASFYALAITTAGFFLGQGLGDFMRGLAVLLAAKKVEALDDVGGTPASDQAPEATD